MVKTRAKDYGNINQSNPESRRDEGNDSEEESTEESTTPTQPPRPTTPTSILSTVFSTLSIRSPTRTPATHTMPPKTVAAEPDIPEWKTLNFRSKMMSIVRNSGDQLKKDGSNYRDWEFRIRDLIDDWIEPGWLDRDDAHIIDPKGDRIVLMMIKYSLETDITMKISKALSAADAMRTIRALFYFPSRSKQVACLRNTLAVRLEDDDDVDTCLRAIADGFDELERDGFVFTKDSLISICYELALPARYSEVTSTLNSVLRAKPTEPITAKTE